MSGVMLKRNRIASLATANVGTIMLTVVLALLPGIVLHVWYFGWGVAVNIALACVSALAFEAWMLTVRGAPVLRHLADGSAVVTALLLALSLPPLVTWWIPVIGSFVAIVVAKQLYGGLGNNTFNPAMAAYAVLLIAFPLQMSAWVAPVAQLADPVDLAGAWRTVTTGGLVGPSAFDAVTAATPLDLMRTELAQGHSTSAIRQADTFGVLAGYGSEWVSVAYLLGGSMLILLRVISWQIPVALLASLAGVAWLGALIAPEASIDPMLHMLGGATMLGAFFIATDPVTAATTPTGKLLYGGAIGLLIYGIRTWGGYPDGVAFAVLLAGMLVPILDRYALPAIFGARRGNERDY